MKKQTTKVHAPSEKATVLTDREKNLRDHVDAAGKNHPVDKPLPDNPPVQEPVPVAEPGTFPGNPPADDPNNPGSQPNPNLPQPPLRAPGTENQAPANTTAQPPDAQAQSDGADHPESKRPVDHTVGSTQEESQESMGERQTGSQHLGI